MSCKQDKLDDIVVLKPITNRNLIDVNYVINDSFPKGDTRRYGIFPNKSINSNYLNNVLYLASKGLPINFSKGLYKTNLQLKSKNNITLNFNEAVLAGSLSIIDQSSRINIAGQLTILDKLFIRESSHINFNHLNVLSDTINNLYQKKNRGVSIYAGSKYISFNGLNIKNTGGLLDNHYKLTAAALQIHGYNNNPEYIKIKNLKITGSDRTALYLTGNHHFIENAKISNFGLGSNKNMFGLEDAIPGTEKEFTGAWLNKCNNVIIDSLEINQASKKGVNSIRLDEGKYHEPTFINHIKIANKAKLLKIADHQLTNVLVKDEYE